MRIVRKLDPNACFAAMKAIASVLAKGDRLSFVGPIATKRVDFNSHRVFAPTSVLKPFTDAGLQLMESCYVRVRHGFIPKANLDDVVDDYSCGLWMFTK